MTGIGTLNESHLHAALKERYRQPGDQVEAPLDGFVADLLRGDLLIEIQTGSFSSLGRKLDDLLDHYRVHLVHPVAAETWIVKLDAKGERTSRRKSPRSGIAAEVCVELVAFPSLLSHPNLSLDVVMVHAEEVRQPGRGAWRRRGWEIADRRLVDVVDTVQITSPRDLLTLLPSGLPDPFTTADLAGGLGCSRDLAQKVAYCLRESSVIEAVGRDKRGVLYGRPPAMGT